MPPKKEPCRNFQRGSCHYGDRCKFLHVTQQQPKPNVLGFGMQSGTQYQRTNLQQQKPNPFGFDVQNSSQPRGVNDFGSKQNQFKPFENKWTRFSPINVSSSPAPRQPDNLPPAPNHKCTDPECCKRQIIEDIEHERPLWKLTCYSHCKNARCDIVGDISYEELRAAAYDDAKCGLSLQSIVERERNLLNFKLLEFESLLRNPYAVPPKSTLATQCPFPVASPNVSPLTAQNSTPPAVSSFSQLGASLNMGFGRRPTAPHNALGQPNSSQVSRQTSTVSGTNNFSFGNAGSLGFQLPIQSLGSSFASSTASFNNSGISVEENPFFSPQVPNSASNESSVLANGPTSASNAVAELTAKVHLMDNMPSKNGAGDNSIWLKEEWNPGEIPEEAPPDEVLS